MAEKKNKDDVSKLGFEESIVRLKTIVGLIEQGEIPLQDSLEKYEQGMLLIKHCRDILQRAEKRIEKITKEQSGDTSSDEADAASEPAPKSEEGEALF
jgi:exodeoxyribonuclease VII small subunit